MDALSEQYQPAKFYHQAIGCTEAVATMMRHRGFCACHISGSHNCAAAPASMAAGTG
jgi:acetolactate synthase regulatory subunit